MFSQASGDYIGMALRNNILHVIYKLNGEEYDIEASSITESSSDVAFFDKIDLYRYSNMHKKKKVCLL